MPLVNKKQLVRKGKMVQTKTRRRMNCEWIGKTVQKKIRYKKIKKQWKLKWIWACEQRTISDKPNFSSKAVFSLYFKNRAKKSYAAKPLAFLLLFLFRRDQNHFSILISNIMKMCEQILKKDSTPIQFHVSEL